MGSILGCGGISWPAARGVNLVDGLVWGGSVWDGVGSSRGTRYTRYTVQGPVPVFVVAYCPLRHTHSSRCTAVHIYVVATMYVKLASFHHVRQPCHVYREARGES